MRGALLAIAALLLLVPGCGGGGTDVTEAAAIQLEPEVADLRQAAANGSPEAAGQELADLRRLVDKLLSTDELSEGGARRILAAADEVEANLELLATTPPSTTTLRATTTIPATTTTASLLPPPAADEDEESDDDGEGGDGGEGNEKDDENEDESPGRGNGNRGRS